MKNIPQKIYLQIDADGETPEDFNDLKGVSWCVDRINENDIEYVLGEQLDTYKKSLISYLEHEQDGCLDDMEYKALERVIQFINDKHIDNQILR